MAAVAVQHFPTKPPRPAVTFLSAFLAGVIIKSLTVLIFGIVFGVLDISIQVDYSNNNSASPMETEASISKTDLITILVLAPIIETIPLAVVGWMIQRTGLPLWSFLTISGVAHFFLHGGDLVDLEIAAIFIALALVWWIARRRYGGAYAFGLTAIAHAGINSFVVSARLL